MTLDSRIFANFFVLILSILWHDELVNSVSITEKVFNRISLIGEQRSSFVPKQIRRRAVDYAAVTDFSNIPVLNDTMENLPEEFDSRLQWPYCPSIGEISDQASCASCWAVSAVDAMSDRICIHSKGKHKVRLSASNLINCCTQCGEGCSGGYYKPAWKYWTVHGIVSGGAYEGEGCQPYEFKPCEHLLVNKVPSCIKDGPTPACKKTCQSNYSLSYENATYYGKSAYVITFNEQAIKTEIYRNGPVQGSVKMFSDLYNYKTGVYEFDHKGHFIFHHAVRIIGWGVDNSTKVPYWLVANSFNRNWGENGFFRIKRGSNECWIEEGIVAGLPKVSEN